MKYGQNEDAAQPPVADTDYGPFAASLSFHLVLLVMLALISLTAPPQPDALVLTLPTEQVVEEELSTPERIQFSDDPAENVGANSFHGDQAALAQALELDPVSEIFNFAETIETPEPDIDVNLAVDVSTAERLTDSVAVRGSTGENVTGASGAVDRITQEILLSLEDRKTLVVWLFDQSGSLARQREMIRDRFEKIYEELGILEAAGNEAFTKHKDTPLLSAVIAFGQDIQLMTKEPTADPSQIQAAVNAIQQDDSGKEFVFRAIYAAADLYKGYRRTDPSAGGPRPQRDAGRLHRRSGRRLPSRAGKDDRDLSTAGNAGVCGRRSRPVRPRRDLREMGRPQP